MKLMSSIELHCLEIFKLVLCQFPSFSSLKFYIFRTLPGHLRREMMIESLIKPHTRRSNLLSIKRVTRNKNEVVNYSLSGSSMRIWIYAVENERRVCD